MKPRYVIRPLEMGTDTIYIVVDDWSDTGQPRTVAQAIAYTDAIKVREALEKLYAQPPEQIDPDEDEMLSQLPALIERWAPEKVTRLERIICAMLAQPRALTDHTARELVSVAVKVCDEMSKFSGQNTGSRQP